MENVREVKETDMHILTNVEDRVDFFGRDMQQQNSVILFIRDDTETVASCDNSIVPCKLHLCIGQDYFSLRVDLVESARYVQVLNGSA